MQAPGLAHGGLAVARLPDHDGVRLHLEDRAEADPHQRLVVDHEHSCHPGRQDDADGEPTTGAAAGGEAAALLGTAVLATTQLVYAGTYRTLGEIGALSTTSPGALEAWHISGAEGVVSMDLVVLLVAVAAGGLTAKAFPRWLTWSALALLVMALTPLAFFALLLFHLWAVAAGISMTLRRGPFTATGRPTVEQPAAVGGLS